VAHQKTEKPKVSRTEELLANFPEYPIRAWTRSLAARYTLTADAHSKSEHGLSQGFRITIRGISHAIHSANPWSFANGGGRVRRIPSRLRKEDFSVQYSLSGWKPLLISRQLRHEWNSCPSQTGAKRSFPQSARSW
jgi:hypothetical protein